MSNVKNYYIRDKENRINYIDDVATFLDKAPSDEDCKLGISDYSLEFSFDGSFLYPQDRDNEDYKFPRCTSSEESYSILLSHGEQINGLINDLKNSDIRVSDPFNNADFSIKEMYMKINNIPIYYLASYELGEEVFDSHEVINMALKYLEENNTSPTFSAGETLSVDEACGIIEELSDYEIIKPLNLSADTGNALVDEYIEDKFKIIYSDIQEVSESFTIQKLAETAVEIAKKAGYEIVAGENDWGRYLDFGDKSDAGFFIGGLKDNLTKEQLLEISKNLMSVTESAIFIANPNLEKTVKEVMYDISQNAPGTKNMMIGNCVDTVFDDFFENGGTDLSLAESAKLGMYPYSEDDKELIKKYAEKEVSNYNLYENENGDFIAELISGASLVDNYIEEKKDFIISSEIKKMSSSDVSSALKAIADKSDREQGVKLG